MWTYRSLLICDDYGIHLIEICNFWFSIFNVSDSNAIVLMPLVVEAKKAVLLSSSELQLSLHYVESQGHSEVHKFLSILC